MSVHLLRNPVVKNVVARIWNRHRTPEDCRKILNDIGRLLLYEVVEYLQTQQHDDKAAEADKAEVRNVVTPLFPNQKIEFANVNDKPFDESQLFIVMNMRGSAHIMYAVLECLTNADSMRDEHFFDEKIYVPGKKNTPPINNFNGKIGVVADTLIDKSTAACVRQFKDKDAAKVIIVSVFTSPEELEKIYTAHPDVEIFVASIADARGLIESL